MNTKDEAKALLELIHRMKGDIGGTDTVSFTGPGYERLERLLKAVANSEPESRS